MLDLLGNSTFAHLARPARLPDGGEPEQRLILCGVGWEGHLALDEAFGHDRSRSHFFYLDGDLEIMSTSDEHERIRKQIASCMDIFFDLHGVRDFPRGQATMRLVKEAGAEPDDSWCFVENKKFPDLVLEIALTSGGLPKLEIYRRFAVPEVWIWRRKMLEIYCLRPDGSGYDSAPASRLLPPLPIAALQAAVVQTDAGLSRRQFRTAFQGLTE